MKNTPQISSEEPSSKEKIMDNKNETGTLKTVLIVLLGAAVQCVTFIICRYLLENRNNGKKRVRKAHSEKVRLIFSENGSNEDISPELLNSIKNCCIAALEEEKIDERAEVSLTVVDNEEIRELNNEFRGKDSVTDVLSFPMSENGEYDVDPETNRIMLGDIVISAEKARQQAEEYGHSFEREMCFLATHSMFHLLGYDHEISEEEEKIMFQKQNMVLDRLGIIR